MAPPGVMISGALSIRKGSTGRDGPERPDGWLNLLPRFISREITSEKNRGMLGWFWFVVTPILLLMVYWFVFGIIFQARAPQGLEVPFVAWLAVALWPWLAFSDGCLRGARSIRQHAALLSKLAIPRALLTTSSLTAAFILQMLGYSIVLLVLWFADVPLSVKGLPHLLLVMTTLYFFALGFALFFAAVQTFLRDLEQLLPTLFMFWFFLTPILYGPDLLPSGMERWLQFNPMTWWMDEIRNILFHGKWLPDAAFITLVLTSAVSFWVGKRVFDRLSPHFEDFL